MPKRKVTQVEFAPRLGDFGRAPTAKLRVAAYARVSTEKEEHPIPRHCGAHHRSQRRTACVYLHKRQRGDGDDVMNACKLRAGYKGRLFFCY